MKNFLHKEDHAPICPNSRIIFNINAAPHRYLNIAKKQKQHGITALSSSMILVFFLCHSQILYRNKIKSPE